MKKILAVCHEGHCRSVATASILKCRGYDAIPVGVNKNSKETIDMLIDWADCILVADQKEIIHRLPLKALPKIDLRFNIGEDEWGDPNNIELWNIIQHQLDGFKDYPMIKRDRTY